MRAIVLGVLALAAGCGQQAVESDCQDLCQELVHTCDLGAFPDHGSCVQGCEYNASEGADIRGQLDCVEAAACDTFAIVECEHHYGVE